MSSSVGGAEFQTTPYPWPNMLFRPVTVSRKENDPTFADAWYNLGDLLDKQGRVEAAIECLRTVLRITPDHADASFNLALLLQRTNQYAEATDYWRRYLASDCQSEWAARARRSLKFCEMQLHLVASA